MIGEKDLWYLVYCRPRQELRAQQHLANQGFATFLPRICAAQDAPSNSYKDLLFPRYLFIQPKQDIQTAWGAVRSTRGVVDFVRFSGKPATVPSAILLGINAAQLTGATTPAAEFQQGDKVVIDQGLYRGIEAIWQCSDGDKRSMLLIELMQTQVSVSFNNKEFYKALN